MGHAGAIIAGGKGTALGTFIGALMLAVLKVGMVVINVDSFWQFVVTGIIIIVASYFEFIQQDVAGFISRHKKAENYKINRKKLINIAALIYFQYELNYNKGAGKNKLCAFILFNNRKQNKF